MKEIYNAKDIEVTVTVMGRKVEGISRIEFPLPDLEKIKKFRKDTSSRYEALIDLTDEEILLIKHLWDER